MESGLLMGGRRRLTRRTRLCTIALLAPALAACTAPPPPAPPATLETHPAAVATYPPGTSTGREDLDLLIQAALEQEPRAILDWISLTTAACSLTEGLGGPPRCRAGEPEGTPVEVLPFLGAEGHFLRRDELVDWEGLHASGLVAAYEVSTDAFSDESYPSGEWAIVLEEGRGGGWVILQVRDGRIVRIDFAMGGSADESIRQQADGWLLPILAGAE